MAATPGLAGYHRSWAAVLRAVSDAVQRLADLHHRRARRLGAFDAAAADAPRRRAASRRAADETQDGGRAHRDAGGRHSPLGGARRRASGGLARRPHHGRGSVLHGALQHLVEALHPPLRPDPFHDHGHGRRRGGAADDLMDQGQLPAGGDVRHGAMAGSRLSRPVRSSSGPLRWSERRRHGSRSQSRSIRSRLPWSELCCSASRSGRTSPSA